MCALAIACGPSSPAPPSSSELALRGAVSASARRLDNARVTAVASTGETRWAYLDARGAFELLVPVGASYTLVVSNTLPGNGQRAIGHLMMRTGAGLSPWLVVRKGGSYDLGTMSALCAGASDDDRDIGLACEHDPHGSVGDDDDAAKEEERDDDDRERACAGDPPDAGSAPPPPPPPSPGTGTTGSPCTTAADCATGFLCAASHCFPSPVQ